MTQNETGRIARVGITGGTHGNEYTGAFLALKWQADPTPVTRGSFETKVSLSNPRAFDAARRYVHQDLNRSFQPARLAEPSPEVYEQGRAAEIAREMLDGVDPASLVLLDLHSTTANMGTSLVLDAKNPFNLAMTAYMQARSDTRAYLWVEASAAEPPGFLNAMSPYGGAIEIGPLPNAVLRADILARTEQAVQLALDFVHAWNQGERCSGLAWELFVHDQHVDFPRDDAGRPSAVIHPDLQDQDFTPLRPGDPMFLGFDGRVHPYDGDETRYPVFINEAAYYEKGIALTLTKRERGHIA